MTARQRKALQLVRTENAAGRLPTMWWMGREKRVSPQTIASLRSRGWMETHLPEVGTDGQRLTRAGETALARSVAAVRAAKVRGPATWGER